MNENGYTVNEIKEVVFPVAKKYGVDKIYLFGSFARGDSKSDSDIDLRIDKGRVRGLQMASLLLDLEEALGRHVDLLSTKALDNDFLKSIEKEEKIIYESDQ